MKCYVFVTDREFDRYRRSGIDTRYLGGQQSDRKAAGISGSKRIRYNVFRDGDGLVVVIDGAEGSLEDSKSEVRKHLSPQSKADDISGFLTSYLSDVKAVIEECARGNDSVEVTLFTHWGGGMPQDVSAIERIVREALPDCWSADQRIPYDKWKTYSISSVRPEVFDISRGEIQIPDLKECAEIESRAEVYGGIRDWLNTLALVCASPQPELLIESLPNPALKPDDVQKIVERIGMVKETKDACGLACRLVEEGAKGKNDLLGFLASSDTVRSDGNFTLKELKERSAALLARLVDGEM